MYKNRKITCFFADGSGWVFREVGPNKWTVEDIYADGDRNINESVRSRHSVEDLVVIAALVPGSVIRTEEV